MVSELPIMLTVKKFVITISSQDSMKSYVIQAAIDSANITTTVTCASCLSSIVYRIDFLLHLGDS